MNRSHTIRAGALLGLLMLGCEAADPAAPGVPEPAFSATITPTDPPFYARVERPFTIHTDDWAALIFYRTPSCVPVAFNLLDLFHVPDAFFCGPLTVEGWEMRKSPDPFSAPFQSVYRGLGGVPVWLVSWADMQAAMADDVVTKGEVMALPSFIAGTASEYEEMLQPLPTRIPSRVVINARGSLANGQGFRVHYVSEDTFSGNNVRSVRIDVW
jgi:hypothetical protein